MAKYTHTYGGVGAPVGLTVFKTAEGSLGAVPGGFDSHTPLPFVFGFSCCVSFNSRADCRHIPWRENSGSTHYATLQAQQTRLKPEGTTGGT